MMESQPRTPAARVRVISFIIASAVTLTSIPVGVSAELPHENFELVGSDLEMMIALLNSSIRASENALRQFYDEDVAEANQYLSMAGGILIPANQILTKIQDIAGSYENLSSLLPPFVQLQALMGQWSSQEASLLEKRDDIVTASHLANLTDEDLLEAIAAIKTVQALIVSMNRTIDSMLVSADEITALTVDLEHVFSPNELRPLIEKLRELLRMILAEIESLIQNDIPWGPTPPGQEERAFVLLWLADSQLFLGETIIGGGYLYYNGSFRSDQEVHIRMNSSELMTVVTGAGGAFSFTKKVPFNASWLGTHVFIANATTPFVELMSDPVQLIISLVPAKLTIRADKTLVSIDETVTVWAELVDFYGEPISYANCSLAVGTSSFDEIGDVDGEFMHQLLAQDLWFGSHSIQAFYEGVLPYASSESNIIIVTVSIPTTITFQLFSDKFRPGHYIVGKGTLFANMSDPLFDQSVTILIDEVVVENATTAANGDFAIAISSTGLDRGVHVLRAAFLNRDPMWRYCEVEVTFTITKFRLSPYPFFPVFPGWETGPIENIPYLFFGENAYYTWLFLILVIAIIVKALQIRRAMRKPELKEAPLLTETPFEETEPDFMAQALAAGEGMFETLLAQSPTDPNGKIVWYYNSLIAFLVRKRRISISDSMTHWEVARLLKSLGFASANVEKITILFEQAFYSGTKLTDLDSISMSVALDGLRARKVGGGAAAV